MAAESTTHQRVRKHIIDPPAASISIPGQQTAGLGADDLYLYANTRVNGNTHLSKVEIATGQEVARFSPAFEDGVTGYGAGTDPEARLFAADFKTSQVLTVDPTTGETSRGFDVPFDPAGITYDPDRESVWISNITFNEVHEFSPSGTERRSFDAQSTTTPAGIGYHNGFVWLGDKEDPSHLYKYTPDGTLRETREIGPRLKGVAGNSDGVIVPDGTGDVVFTVGGPSGAEEPGESTDSWSQQQKLSADDGDEFDRFGVSAALSADGTTALLGAQDDDEPNGRNAGSAYVFTRSDGSWSQQQKLSADDGDADDRFGESAALSADGTTALLGAFGDEDPNGPEAGSAYVFTRSDGSWSQQQKLSADDGDDNDGFGFPAALSADGTTALLGAQDDEDPNGRFAGSAYVFTSGESLSATVPTAQFDITDNDGPTAETEVGIELQFDASASTDSDASIARYEWDFTGNGTTDVTTTDPVVSRSFGSVGEQQITLRVVNTQGRSATATQSLTVHLRDYFETLTTARQIDTRSTLSVVNQALESLPDVQTVTGAEQRAQQTVTALETAVQEERVEQTVAQDAVERLLLGQQGVLLTVNRTGTGDVEIGEPYNLSLLVVEKAVNTLIGIIIAAEVAQGQLSESAGNAIGFSVDAARFALSKLDTIVDTVLTTLLGSGETKRAVKRQLADVAVRIVSEISSGELSTAGEVQAAANNAADAIVEAVTAGPQSFVDFNPSAEVLVVQSLINPTTAILNILTAQGATYEAVATLNDQLQPAAVSGGLPGTAETVRQNVDEHQSAINSTVATAVGVIDRIGIATRELSLFETVVDIVDRDRDPPLQELLSVIGTALNLLFSGIISIVSNVVAVLTGVETLIYLKTQQAILIEGVLAGEEVPFVSV
jgi:hypothetical protein